MIAKHKNVRLHGKALSDLNTAIYERDGGCCIVCGKYVEPGTKFHHVRQASYKTDEIDNGVTLCPGCHYEAHHGDVTKIKAICQNYLKNRYGER